MSLQRPERPRNFVPPQIPPGPSRRFIEYLIGLGIGAIPLALALFALGILASTFSGLLSTLSIYLYIGLFIVTIICLLDHRSRFIGYGMFTMFLISPIVWYICCMATFRYCYHGCVSPTREHFEGKFSLFLIRTSLGIYVLLEISSSIATKQQERGFL